MKEDNAIFPAMFEHATTGILIVDTEGKIIKANPFLERMFGYGDGELLGEPMDVLLPKGLRIGHRHHRNSFFKAPAPRPMGKGKALFGQRKDGSEFPVEISLGYTQVDDQQLAIGFVNDISARKKAELGLKKEKELNQLKSRFVSMASHEFRTPLTAIQASAELIDMYIDRENPEKQRKHIARITSSVKNLTSILDDFLSLEKVESNKTAYDPEWLDLPDFVASVLEEVQLLVRKGQQLRYRHVGPEPAFLDEHLVRNILMNLLSNAIKYSPEGGQVDLTTTQGHNCLKIEVVDQGIGIPKEEQSQMFNRFFRAQNAVGIKGTGLGLTIVKRYLDMMGGSIDFTSELNAGTTFNVEIPQEPDEVSSGGNLHD